LQLQPNYPDARRNVAQVLAHLGRVPEAIAHYQVLVQLLPHDEKARAELAQLRALPPP
jgi:regulator of sirC expression with transglutaminase-like and TPR domain